MFATTTLRINSSLFCFLAQYFLAQLVLFAVLVAAAPSTYARSIFDAELDLSLSVVTPAGKESPVIENKFGFATSFPRPRDNAGDLTGQPNPVENWDLFALQGGTAVQKPNPFVAKGKKVTHGRGLKFHVGGETDAFVPGDYSEGEGWASGRTRIRLGNFTGHEGLPPAEAIQVNLQLNATGIAKAQAVNGDASFDWASAKYFYELTSAATGAVLASSPGGPAGHLATSEEGDLAAGIANAAQQNIVPVNLPSNSFTEIDLFGHVYASGFSDVTAGPPPAVAPGWAAPFQQRANQLFPDADMDLGSLDDWGPLFGDVVGHGSWLVADVAGVNGSDPLATSGNDTVFTTQIATNPNQLQDLEISVETPVGDYTVFSFDNDVIAAGGVHLFDYRLELGTGVGDQFQGHAPLGQDGQLQFLLEGSSADRQIEQTGTFELVDGNDPVSLHTLQFLGELSPGQGAQFQTQILVHDSVDGVTDGMARLTLRHLTEGIAGDYNGDYVVDQGDYDLWKETFGSDDGLADGNANGTIDAGDFTLWQDHFQQNHFPFTDFGGESRFGASSSAIPEPATGLISLLGLGAVACLAGRRRA